MSAMVEFRCPHCRAPLSLDRRVAGLNMACPACQVTLAVPALGLPVGEMLGGYRIRRYLGCGGFGEVYEAYQVSMDRTVALKVLPRDRSADPRWTDALTASSRAMARVRHPAVVHAVDAGAADGLNFLATWLVEGDDLAWRVERQGRMPQEEVVRIGREAALALGHAWEQHQLAHGNLKPTNLMLDKAGAVLLLDFGLARPLHAEAVAAMNPLLDCTANYVSPEQAGGAAAADFRADLYSLGATLYFAATGVAPYFGASPRDIVERLLQQPLPPAQKLNPALGPQLSALLSALMATDPARRPASWIEVLGEFDRMAKANAERKAVAPPPPPAAPAPAPAARPPPPARRPQPVRPEGTPPVPVATGGTRSRGLVNALITLAILAAMGVADLFVWRIWKQRKAEGEQVQQVEDQRAATAKRADVLQQELADLRARAADPGADRSSLRLRLASLKQQAAEAGGSARFAEEFMVLDSQLQAAEETLPAPEAATAGASTSSVPETFFPVLTEPRSPSPAGPSYAADRAQIMKGLAGVVIADRMNQAARALDEVMKRYDDPAAREEMQALKRAMPDLGGLGARLAATFLAQTGQVLKVAFRTGDERLMVREADAAGCRADQVALQDGKIVASSPRRFRYDELALDEVLRRLKAGGGEPPPLLAGLAAARAGQSARAAVFLRQSDSPWGRLLADQLEAVP